MVWPAEPSTSGIVTVGVEARVGGLLLAGLSEEAQKTDQMGMEILTDIRTRDQDQSIL